MIKEEKVEGVGLLKGVIELTNTLFGKGLSEKEVTMEDENEASKPTEAQEALARMIPLSSPDKLPKDFAENCQHIWEAFNLGRHYEHLIREEE